MTSLVYVWIGSELPAWARLSLQLAKKTSGLEVILLCNHSIGFVQGVSRQYYIEEFYIQPKPKEKLKKKTKKLKIKVNPPGKKGTRRNTNVDFDISEKSEEIV